MLQHFCLLPRRQHACNLWRAACLRPGQLATLMRSTVLACRAGLHAGSRQQVQDLLQEDLRVAAHIRLEGLPQDGVEGLQGAGLPPQAPYHEAYEQLHAVCAAHTPFVSACLTCNGVDGIQSADPPPEGPNMNLLGSFMQSPDDGLQKLRAHTGAGSSCTGMSSTAPEVVMHRLCKGPVAHTGGPHLLGLGSQLLPPECQSRPTPGTRAPGTTWAQRPAADRQQDEARFRRLRAEMATDAARSSQRSAAAWSAVCGPATMHAPAVGQ